MADTRRILLVEDDEAVADLFARVVRAGLPDTTVLHARSGLDAIEIVRAHPLDLVILDIHLLGPMSGREVCLKIRALHPTVPILPCTVDLAAAPLLSDLGCAPVVAKQQLASNPFSLLASIRAACQIPPVTRVPAGAFHYMLERADAALAEELRQAQVGVVVLCRHPLLRTGLTRAIASLGVNLLATAADSEELLRYADAALATSLIIGTLGDLAMLQLVGRMLSRPVLVIATQRRDLDELRYAQLAGASVVLFDDQGDALQLLAAVHALARGQGFVAVPAAVLARWVPPLAGLSSREWEIVIATLLTPSREAVAQACGVAVESVETYWKRVRRRLTPHSQPEILEQARAQLVARLGLLPAPLAAGPSARALGAEL